MENDEYLTHGLCPACFCIDFGSPNLSYEDRPIADIVASCKVGCTFCSLLTFSLDLKLCMVDVRDTSAAFVYLLRHNDHPSAENVDRITAVLIYGYDRDPARVTFDITILHNQWGTSEDAIAFLAPQTPAPASEKSEDILKRSFNWVKYQLDKCAGSRTCHSTLEMSAPASEKSEDILKRSFNWVKDQLDKCAGSHTCHSTLETPLPTRVLDLSDNEPTNVRVFVPEQGTMGRYAALSYCWGRSNHFVLTAATLEALQNGFHLSQLPQTIQDAVKVAREVGLKYLWVDALCIIQGKDADAINDWNIEVAKMDAVYRDAYITVCAAAAQNASGGLFRGSHCDLPFVSTLTSSGLREVALWARATWRNNTPGFTSEPINSRAWTLQEHTLSSRLLFYTSSGLMWKCNRELISVYSGESRVFDFTIPAEAETPGVSAEKLRFLSNTSRYTFSVFRDGDLKASSWITILELYTARNLTNPHDKLPALAAIARRYSHSTGAEYLAGLWKQTFRQDLLWHHQPRFSLNTVSDGGNPMRSNEYRAPSWSWAAVDGVIVSRWAGRVLNSSKTYEYTWLAEVTTYPIPVLVNPGNKFGGIVKMSTELQMRGPVETFRVREYSKEKDSVRISSANGGPDDWKLSVDDYTNTAAWRGREKEPLFCLHVLTVMDNTDRKSKGSRFSFALALLRVHELHNTYIRIGLASGEESYTSPSTQFEATKTVIIL